MIDITCFLSRSTRSSNSLRQANNDDENKNANFGAQPFADKLRAIFFAQHQSMQHRNINQLRSPSRTLVAQSGSAQRKRSLSTLASSNAHACSGSCSVESRAMSCCVFAKRNTVIEKLRFFFLSKYDFKHTSASIVFP